MLFYISIALFGYFFIFRRRSLRFFLFAFSVVLAFFFFASYDPVIKMPLYIYFCILSILFSLSNIGNGKHNRLIQIGLCLILCLFVQIVFLGLDFVDYQVLLINKSNTDILNVTSQLQSPQLDMNVIKHFVFFVIFILFLIANADYFNPVDKNRLWRLLILIYYVFFTILIFQSFVVNILGISQHNITLLLKSIFCLQGVIAEYSAFGIKSCQAWLQEPSGIIFVLPLLCYILRSPRLTGNHIALLFLTDVSCALSTSTTGIVVSLLFSFLIILKQIFVQKNTNLSLRIFFVIIFVLGALISLINFQSIFDKIIDFISFKQVANSAGYRSQSLMLAIQVFLHYPMLGVGIGTVYCHGMVIQVLANIGVLGFGFSFLLFIDSMRLKLHKENLLLLILNMLIFCAGGLLQEFTSPHMIPILLAVLDSSILWGRRERKKTITAIYYAQKRQI